MSLAIPTLPTEHLLLRPVTRADEQPLIAMHTSARVLRYWDSPPWPAAEPERATAFVERSARMAAEEGGVRVAIQRRADGRFLGWCSLSQWNPTYRSASLGLCLDEPAWGLGYATEAAGALLDWAFEELDLIRVQAEVDTRNAACVRVLEKLGFSREGMLRQNCIVAGEVSDSYVYGLLREER